MSVYCEDEKSGYGHSLFGNAVYYGVDASGLKTSVEGFKYLVSDSKATIVGYVGRATDIVIPSIIGNERAVVVNIGDSAFYKSSVESVVIEEGIKSIGKYAFSHSKLKKITLPKGLEKIKYMAFCSTEIEYIDIPESVTEIGDWAFKCEKIRFLIMPKSVEKFEGGLHKNTKLFARAESKPTGWAKDWNVAETETEWNDAGSERTYVTATTTVVWGFKGTYQDIEAAVKKEIVETSETVNDPETLYLLAQDYFKRLEGSIYYDSAMSYISSFAYNAEPHGENKSFKELIKTADYIEAVRCLEIAAKAGQPDATLEYAMRLEYERKYKDAFYFYGLAAERGMFKAYARLGLILSRKEDGGYYYAKPKENVGYFEEVLDYWQKGADTGDADSQFFLGEVYYKAVSLYPYGSGIKEDYKQCAIKLLGSASMQGHKKAMELLVKAEDIDAGFVIGNTP
jgi:TPR repeat protein